MEAKIENDSSSEVMVNMKKSKKNIIAHKDSHCYKIAMILFTKPADGLFLSFGSSWKKLKFYSLRLCI